MTASEIKTNLDIIQACLDQKINVELPEEIVGKATELINIQSLSANCVSESLRLLKLSEANMFDAALQTVTAPSLISKFIDGRTANEQALYKLSEKIDSAIRHSIEMYRSILSLRKEELRISSYQGQH